MRKKRMVSSPWSVVLWTVLLVIALYPARPAFADEIGVRILSINQQDMNSDGKPDLTVIECAFATDRDLIYVVDQGNDMRSSMDWQEATDFSNDIWLYDIGGDDSIQLVVRYQIENNHNTAYVFDDRNDDGRVTIERNNTGVKILESPYWTARIVSGSNWFLPDGRINLNVTIQLDGPIPTLDRAPAEYINNWLPLDGLIDVEFEEVAGRDGIAQYAVKRLLTDSPGAWGFERSGLYSNEGKYPTRPHDRMFFPFLPIPIDSQHDPRFVNLRYFDLPPDVKVDWTRGKVLGVELVGYPIGHGYHFNNNRYIVKGQVNDVAFESPQAYYDLAMNHDAFAEMHVRFFTHPPNDYTMWSLPNFEAIPWQSIGYDWNLFNLGSLLWDFKIGVTGNYDINSQVKFRDFTVNAVPFEELPFWITERDWKLTMFLAREGEGYQSSEGIYEWDPHAGDDPVLHPERADEAREAIQQYTLGLVTSPPNDYFQTTHVGYRAERHFADPIKPYLYFSPLDRKMHLRGAETGLWTVDNNNVIRYANLNEDAYLDQWSHYENGQLQRQFYWAGDYLIYAGENNIWLKNTEVPASLFETLPPRNHEEWLAQRQMLEANRPDFAPDDFKAMLTQFRGRTWQLQGATMRDFRPDGEGFRFILEVQPDFHVIGSGGSNWDHLVPGTYVVSYQNSFTFTPSSPTDLAVTLLPVTLAPLQINSLPVEIQNKGLEDLPQATLELWASSPNGATSIVADQTFELPAERSSIVKLTWSPTSSGTWILTPKIRQPDGRLISGNPVSIVVAHSSNQNPLSSLFVSTAPQRLPVIVLGLVILATLTALVFWQEWGRPLVKRVNEQTESVSLEQNAIQTRCPHCQAEEKQSKAGFNRSGSQRHRCGQCRRIYTPNPKFNGYPVETRMRAIQMYMAGNNYGAISRVLKVSPQSVIRWVKQYIASSAIAVDSTNESIPKFDETYSFADYDMKSSS